MYGNPVYFYIICSKKYTDTKILKYFHNHLFKILFNTNLKDTATLFIFEIEKQVLNSARENKKVLIFTSIFQYF